MDIIEDGVNGYLVDVEDAEALAERLVRVLTAEEGEWLAMSDAAYASARRFTWEQATELFERALLKAVVRRQAGPAPGPGSPAGRAGRRDGGLVRTG
jgi:glycosyltransferase involved in cell wall biosynthesis